MTNTMTEHDLDDILVMIAHPWGDIEVSLREWIARGPGPRPLVRPVSARRRSTGSAVALTEIPLQYRNDAKSRRLIIIRPAVFRIRGEKRDRHSARQCVRSRRGNTTRDAEQDRLATRAMR
jgi:hypothetical protein